MLRPKPQSSRRSFLKTAVGALASSSLASSVASVASAEFPSSQPVRHELPRRSIVAKTQVHHVVAGRQVRENVLSEVFDAVLTTFARVKTTEEAWHKLLAPDDVIGLKFNHSGAANLGTTPAFARVLVGSLTQAGWSPQQIVLAEVPRKVVQELGTTPFRYGWSESVVDFRSGQDQLASFLDQVTAIINIPFLKTHNIAGLTGCLKNLSHSLVKHPARYHDNGCSPYVADIVGLDSIRSKLRLNIMNGLRTVFAHGPEARPEYIDNTGMVLVGSDPVAVDVVGLDVLNKLRGERGLPAIQVDSGDVPSLVDAAEKGLGHIDFLRIQRLSAQ